MVYAVMQPTVHEQVLSSAIRFVEIAVVNRKDVAIFQVRKSAIIAPVRFPCTPALRYFVPDERIAVAVLFAFPRLINPKEARRTIVRNDSHSRHKVARSLCGVKRKSLGLGIADPEL